MLAALDDGSLLERVAQVAAERERDVATRRRPITGLSEFPNLGETVPTRVATGRPPTVAGYGGTAPPSRPCGPTHRRHTCSWRRSGPVAAHTARAGFATNLLAAGGIAVDVAGATAGVDDLVAAYDGQAVVCLAGTDAAYAEWGSEAARALRAAGARPGDRGRGPSSLRPTTRARPEWTRSPSSTRTREALA